MTILSLPLFEYKTGAILARPDILWDHFVNLKQGVKGRA